MSDKLPPALVELVRIKALTVEERKLAERIALDPYPERFIAVIRSNTGIWREMTNEELLLAASATLINDWPLDRITSYSKGLGYAEPVEMLKAALALIAERHA